MTRCPGGHDAQWWDEQPSYQAIARRYHDTDRRRVRAADFEAAGADVAGAGRSGACRGRRGPRRRAGDPLVAPLALSRPGSGSRSEPQAWPPTQPGPHRRKRRRRSGRAQGGSA